MAEEFRYRKQSGSISVRTILQLKRSCRGPHEIATDATLESGILGNRRVGAGSSSGGPPPANLNRALLDACRPCVTHDHRADAWRPRVAVAPLRGRRLLSERQDPGNVEFVIAVMTSHWDERQISQEDVFSILGLADECLLRPTSRTPHESLLWHAARTRVLTRGPGHPGPITQAFNADPMDVVPVRLNSQLSCWDCSDIGVSVDSAGLLCCSSVNRMASVDFGVDRTAAEGRQSSVLRQGQSITPCEREVNLAIMLPSYLRRIGTPPRPRSPPGIPASSQIPSQGLRQRWVC